MTVRDPLHIDQVLAGADARYERTGEWSKHNSGDIDEAPEEIWNKVENALRLGLRGLPGGCSLYQFLKRERKIET